jgi:hypothetical protein
MSTATEIVPVSNSGSATFAGMRCPVFWVLAKFSFVAQHIYECPRIILTNQKRPAGFP